LGAPVNMKIAGLVFGTLVAVMAPAQAITVETTNFISSPANFNGFEGIGSTFFPTNTPYSEGGITVTYVGVSLGFGGIWTGYTSGIGGEGNFGWYPNGTGAGYTDVKLTSGGGIQAIQFLTGSGWNVPAATTTNLLYQVLNQGVIVLAGTIPVTRNHFGTGTMQYVGFSGGGFDEIKLENQVNILDAFGENFDGGAFDSFAANSATAAPLPAALPLFACGFGTLGLLGWRNKRKAAALAA
jgi:hypothetical protein